jgi:hypothetical protein
LNSYLKPNEAINPFPIAGVTVSCSQNKHLISSNSNSKSQQQLKKTYGPGGKIIYGTPKELEKEIGYTEELEAVEDNNVPEELYDKKESKPKKTSLKKRTKTLFADFKDVVLVRKNFPKIGTSKANVKEYNDPAMLQADKHAKTGFVLAITAVGLFLLTLLIGIGTQSIDAAIILIILGGFGAIILLIIGLVFSILGMKSEKNKVFAIIGLAISALALFLLLLSIVTSGF